MTRLAALLLSPFAPYLLGAVAALVLAAGGLTAWRELVTIPGLRADVAAAGIQVNAAQIETAHAAATITELRKSVASQNAAVDQLAAGCVRASEAAGAAARRILADRAPLKPAADAQELNAWLESLSR